MNSGRCVSCGAYVSLAPEQNQTQCSYCKSPVNRTEAEEQFQKVDNGKFAGTLLIAETSREGGSYEEAITFYNKIIEQDPMYVEAWLNKGHCVLQTSKIGSLKTTEAISSWKAAIKFSKNPDATKRRVAKEIQCAVEAFYPVLESHYKEFSTLSDAYSEHVSRFLKLESALAFALEADTSNPDICATGINLCDSVLQVGVNSGGGNAINAIMSGDYKRGLSAGFAAFANVAALTKPVEELKLKYQHALGKIDPSYKIPGLPDAPAPIAPVKLESPGDKEDLVSPLKGLICNNIVLYPIASASSQKINANELQRVKDFLTFISPSENIEDVLLFEKLPAALAERGLIVTKQVIGWGQRGKEKKGFFSIGWAEEKVVIPCTSTIQVIYTNTGMFGTVEGQEFCQRPKVEYRNPSGVKESAIIPTEQFSEQGSSLIGNKHAKAEALTTFLNKWLRR